jgi:hypothetical protein
MSEYSNPKRRWFRFSLRTLLVFVTIASAGFGWLATKVRAKQREREAVRALLELDCDIVYAGQPFSEDGIMWDDYRVPRGPKWLRNILGTNSSRPLISSA